MIAFAVSPVWGHEAPEGFWAYERWCCDNRDCRPEHGNVTAIDTGWLVEATGEVIKYGDSRIRMSQDGDFHRCVIREKTDDRGSLAAIPPQGS